MSNINLQASISNLSQMDRLQNDRHHNPVASQQQNADSAVEEAAKRLNMPSQTEKAEGKNVDPENRKKEKYKRRKKKKLEESQRKKNEQSENSGHIIDYHA